MAPTYLSLLLTLFRGLAIEETANGQNVRLCRREEKNNQVDSGDEKDVRSHKQPGDEED